MSQVVGRPTYPSSSSVRLPWLDPFLLASHDARYSSIDRRNPVRIPITSVASNVAIGEEPLFTTLPCRRPTESSNSIAAVYPLYFIMALLFPCLAPPPLPRRHSVSRNRIMARSVRDVHGGLVHSVGHPFKGPIARGGRQGHTRANAGCSPRQGTEEGSLEVECADGMRGWAGMELEEWSRRSPGLRNLSLAPVCEPESAPTPR